MYTTVRTTKGFEVKHLGIIRKSTMLVIIAVISTWMYILGQAYILRQIGFYLPFDGVINSLCIACLFQFGDDFYAVTFAKLECCCLCFSSYCNHCPCSCCGDFDESDQQKELSFTTTTASSNAIDVNERNQIKYHAKIHSHHFPAEQNLDIYGNSSNKAFGTSLETKTFGPKVQQTPTQRYVGSFEQQLFVGPRSITEFSPINLEEQQKEESESAVSPNTANKTAFSQTADSAITDSTSNNMMPANRTGAIPVIQKHKNSKLKLPFSF